MLANHWQKTLLYPAERSSQHVQEKQNKSLAITDNPL
jgi:hypothetical protein